MRSFDLKTLLLEASNSPKKKSINIECPIVIDHRQVRCSINVSCVRTRMVVGGSSVTERDIYICHEPIMGFYCFIARLRFSIM